MSSNRGTMVLNCAIKASDASILIMTASFAASLHWPSSTSPVPICQRLLARGEGKRATHGRVHSMVDSVGHTLLICAGATCLHMLQLGCALWCQRARLATLCCYGGGRRGGLREEYPLIRHHGITKERDMALSNGPCSRATS